MIRHFIKSENEPLTWFLEDPHQRGTTACMALTIAKKRCLELQKYNLPVSFSYPSLDRVYPYNIILKFNNDADEAEFILRFSDGIELPSYAST